MISESAKIFPSVKLGKNSSVEDFAVVGIPFQGHKDEETLIGNNALIRSHTVIYAGNMIGDNFQTGHKVNIRENNIIGNNVSIGTHSVIEYQVTIGNGVRIHSMAFVPEYTILEDDCWLGPCVCVTNDPYPRSPREKKQLKGVRIRTKAKIGANVTLLPGIVVGENALIGAGSVVTKDVPDNTIFAGNPAKFMRNIHY